MKAFYLLAPLAAVAVAGCAYETVYTPTPTAYVTPAYVAPSSTVVLGSAPSWGLMDSDGDGYANSIDRFPYDARFH